MNIVWTEPAVDSLQAIRDYVAHDSVFYADLFVKRLIDAAESLQAFPERGREVPEAGNPAVRELLFQSSASSIARTRQLSKFSPSCIARATCR